MKRKIVIVFALMFALTMLGCGNDEKVADVQAKQPEKEIVTELELSETESVEEMEETEEEVIEETETEITVVETINFSDDYTTATKTVYSDELTDYEVWAEIPYWNANVHYRIANMPVNGEVYGLKNVSIVTFANENEDENAIRIKVWAYENIATSQIDLKNMSDTQLGTLDGKNPDLSTMEKIETETTYTIGVQFEIQDFGTTCMAYNYYVNDYENDKAYYVTVNASGEYGNYEFLYDLARSVEVLELN